MRARIAHIVPTDRIAYLMLYARLQRLREIGYELSVICGAVGYADQLRQCGVQVVHIPFAREIAPWTDWRCARSLLQVLRRGHYDAVHTHNPKGGLLGSVVARLAGVPLVVHTVHGFLFNENSTGLHQMLAVGAERWTANWCDHLLFQSEEDYTHALEHRFKERQCLHLIGNGIDERRFDRGHHAGARLQKRAELGLAQEDLVVGVVGRLVREKGFEEFFAMAGRIARVFERARFLVVGITEEKEQSDSIDPKALMAEHGIADRCVVLEQRQDMPELYTCMDLAVLPSYREGIPRALLEAGAMGVPMAASDIRGCREVIVDGQTGMLFPLKNVDAFTEVVSKLLGDGDMRRRLGEAGHRRIMERYTEGRTAARLAACYEVMLKRC